ncbi:MAG: acyl-CoA dehydratase activase [Desulfosoma sp.]|uniref:acyl-CoA dehydratase activase n=1 Tax=Desulfosoma sp. TaxID=2603217 RepID=UPI00404B0913
MPRSQQLWRSILARGLLCVARLRAMMGRSALDALHLDTLHMLADLYARKAPTILAGFFFPVELLQVHGVAPMYGEFLASALASTGLEKDALNLADAVGYPVESCAFHRAALAACLKGYLPPLDAVAATTHLCDSQSKALEELASFLNIPLIFVDLPHESSPEAHAYVAHQLAEADLALSKITGKMPTQEDWFRVFEASNRARERMCRINALRATAPAGVCGKDVSTALIQAQLMFGREQLPGRLAALEDELRRARLESAAGRDAFRVVWLLTFPYFKGNFVPYMERTLGIWPVVDELTYVSWEPLNPERPYESLATKVLRNPGLGPVENRLRMVEALVRMARPDGVVHFSHWGCRQGVGGVQPIARLLEELGMPFLSLDGDSIDSRSYAEGPTRTRLEGFVEVLRTRKAMLPKKQAVREGLFAGIDIGSLTAKAVVVDGQGRVVAHTIRYTGASARRAAQSLQEFLDEVREQHGRVRRCVATGYGRKVVDFADEQITEITCHACGMWHLYPDVRTLIDIGGQDTKAIAINERGEVENFLMNDKCAAGTGRFLELMARALELDVEELGDKASRARRAVSISSVCSVFAESEVVSHIADGCPVEDICRGICESIADRTAALLKKVGSRPMVAMTGGVAKNIGVVKALERRLKQPISVAPEPQIIGALGAALLARHGA